MGSEIQWPFCDSSLPVSCFLALKPGALYFPGDSLDANLVLSRFSQQ